MIILKSSSMTTVVKILDISCNDYLFTIVIMETRYIKHQIEIEYEIHYYLTQYLNEQLLLDIQYYLEFLYKTLFS